MLEEHAEKLGIKSNRRKRKTNIKEKMYIYWSRYVDFFYSPRVNFIYDAVSFFYYTLVYQRGSI